MNSSAAFIHLKRILLNRSVDQHAANQLPELHRYVAERGWEAQEFVDRGV